MKNKRLALLVSIVLMSSLCYTPTSHKHNTIKTFCAPNEIISENIVHDEVFDPYATENRYDMPAKMFERYNRVDYGTVLHDVEYWSSAAGDYKQCNILLPAGYDESETYPVLYVIHGWYGNHSNQIDTDGYLTLLYGNMLHDRMTVPMIIVNVDMYTDKLEDKPNKNNVELRYSYDKVVDDIALDLMPFIEEKYPVRTGRENTAVAGVSQGASEALCTGFKWLDKFGYISGYAPDAGVIPTKWFEGTFWNIPYFDQLPTPDEDTVPYYVYMSVGNEDPENIDITLYYSEVMTSLGIRNQTDLVDGYGHNYLFWVQSFYNYLTKIFRTGDVPVYTEPLDDPILCPCFGDLNNDWVVDIEDVVIVFNHINGNQVLADEQFAIADINNSLTIDIEDAVRYISHINGDLLLDE